MKRPVKPARVDYRQRDPTKFFIAIVLALGVVLVLVMANSLLD
jgi:hypothetical protein